MKAVVQRVSEAVVAVDGRDVGHCGKGLVVLVAAHRDDRPSEADRMADRIWGMRIFGDAEGRMNLSLKDLAAAGEPVGVLAVSNFTVYGDASQRRPSFVAAAPYAQGQELFERMVETLRALGCPVETGEFGAQMDVRLVNDGPVTLVVDVPPAGFGTL